MESNRWVSVRGTPIERFYPASRGYVAQAIYAPSIDRFLLADSFDLGTTLHAAKLLSSKMSLIVFVLPPESPITNENCLRWTLAQKNRVRLSEVDKPVVRLLPSPADLEEVALPTEMEKLAVDQNFFFFVWRATSAMRLTDARLNTVDHPFFLKMFPQLGEQQILATYHDNTKWPIGFMAAVEQILYLSDSVEESLAGLSKLLQYPTTRDPARISSAQMYSKTFFDLLGWRPGTVV